MIKASYCYRRASTEHPLGIWKELPPECAAGRIILRHSSTGKILCPVHCRWEDYSTESSGSEDAVTVQCSGGKSSTGLLVPFVPDEEDSLRTMNNGVILIGDGKHNFLRREDEYKHPWSWNRARTEEKKADPCDANGIPYDSFLFSIKCNLDSISCVLVRVSIDREKFLATKEGCFDLARIPKKEEETAFFFKHTNPENERSRHQHELDAATLLPPQVSLTLEQAAEELVTAYAGRSIRINKGCLRGARLLRALSEYPYEANIYEVMKHIRGSDFQLDRDDSDIYNSLCRKFGLKSFPSLRKLFEAEPCSLIWYKNLYDMGFRDTNVMMDILHLCARTKHNVDFDKHVFYLHKGWMSSRPAEAAGCTTFLKNISRCDTRDWMINAFAFFCERSIALRGERATWNALNREPTMDPSDRADIARQFMRYYTNLKDEERDMVYREGFTTYVHDVLSKIVLCIKNKNIIFNYTAEQESLEDEIDGYTFKLPADSDTLRKIGARMHNCVFSYTDWIIGGGCTIVYAEHLGQPEICIELSSHQSVVQVRGSGNSHIQGERLDVFNRWCEKHGLLLTVPL